MIEKSRVAEVMIRSMELRDIERVHEIDTISFSMPWPIKSYHFDLTRNPAARMWVAEIENMGCRSEVVGMLVLWFIIDEAHIGTIAVHPEFRRCGIGEQLLCKALDGIRTEGARRVYLETRRGNVAAQSLYKKSSFKITGVRRMYYRDNGEDALIMSLENW